MSIPGREAAASSVIRKNLWALGGSYLVAGAAGFVAQAYLARALGQATFGAYIAAFSLVTILAVPARSGRRDYLVREAARDPGRTGEIVGDALVLQLVLAVAVTAIATAAAAALGLSPLPVAVLLAVMAGADATTDALRAGLQAAERMEMVAAISTAVSILSAAAVVAAVAAGWGLTAAIALSALVSILSIPVAWQVLGRSLRTRVRGSLAGAMVVLRASIPFTAIGVLTYAVGYVDALVIERVLGPEAVALYGGAYRLVIVLTWIVGVYEASVFRTMTALAVDAPDRLARFVGRSIAAVVLVAAPFAAGGLLLADRVLAFVFGGGFGAGGNAFAVLLLGLPLVFAGAVTSSAVVAIGRAGVLTGIMAVAFVVNLAANIATVPRYGIVAAAAVTVATEAGVLAATWMVLARVGVRPRGAGLALPGVLGVAALALAVWPLRDAPLIAPLAAGALAYALVLLVARVPARLTGGSRRERA